MAQAILAVLISFVVFITILLFFIKHRQRMPYYQVDQEGCIKVLQEAVSGSLLERDWHIFIGMQVRYDNEIEALRLACLEVDDRHVINTVTKNGKVYMVFSKQGTLVLQDLLDHWQHKKDYLA
ncbi:hypothetical protein MGA5115_01270 [Marinomonas gallaica]|uniref:Uncharacterized protein n=1 Tax=Marinomonas gallaica TaxID=1806667 RepID=A0A1C3JPM0_9GAMM|nr:hypothetical protein [Marinomonas gallaica]SBT17168.1 hypothetical protein MGA5115_01270 [Marinomonas gallaica]SBT19503.1 hypothetical protein MGA5116_00069 [Marinomonas gallaica]